jgi:hypothetical protein
MPYDWQPISSAPFDREVELAVIDLNGVHALVFPCRLSDEGWIDATEKRLLTASTWLTALVIRRIRPYTLTLHVNGATWLGKWRCWLASAGKNDSPGRAADRDGRL